jgi:hypothetical protein
MGGPAIAAYRGAKGDADTELELLGTKTARAFFRFAEKIVSRRLDHWTLQPFMEHGDVPLYKADFNSGFTIFLVEDDPDDGIGLVLMVALPSRPMTIQGHRWDGRDMTFIRASVLPGRLKDYFDE